MKLFQLKQFVKAVLKEVASPSEPVQPPSSGWANMDAKAQLEDLIKSADLNERESLVMTGLISGERTADLARKYNVSPTRIQQIQNKAMRKMRVAAKTADITLKESSDICSTCNGSGEGMADGTACSSCGGSGSNRPRKLSKRNDPDYESPEREDDKRAWGGMDENSEEKERNDLISQISDDYKSLHGMRPRRDMSGYSIAELKAMADQLSSYIHAEIEQEKQDAIQHDKATKKAMTPTKWSIGDLTGLKEGSSEQPIYKDRQGGQDVYWMDNRDSGGKIHIKPEAVAKMVKRGHRVIDINEPMKETSQPEPYDPESDTFQPSPRERTSSTSSPTCPKCKTPIRQEKMPKGAVSHYCTACGTDSGTPVKENEGGQHLINGQSNIVAASRVNKLLAALSRGMFSDNSWEAIHKIFDKLTEAGLEVNTIDAKYGGHADTGNGMPKYKEWRISIPFTNNKGKAVELVGQITAHGAGSVDQPLDRYDITAMVTPMMVKNKQ